jgi:hypothetical protein
MRLLLSIPLFFLCIIGFTQPTIPPNQLRGLVGGGNLYMQTNNVGTVSWSNTIGTTSGTAASPSRYFSSSTNTGDFYDGGYGISVAGTKRLGISNTGNLYLNSPNTFIGQAGNATLSGYQNVGVGSVMAAIRGGIGNTAIGYFALDQDTSGNYNFALGAYSQYQNRNSSDNVSVGAFTLTNVRSGRSVAIGTSAGAEYTSGEHNTAIGYGSGGGNQTGSKNISIGYQASAYAVISNYNNSIVIGNDIYNTSSATNKIILGNASNDLLSLGNGKFNLPLKNYTMADHNKVLTVNGNTNVVDFLETQNVGNTNLTLTSDRYLYGTYGFYLGTPLSGAKLGVSNTVAGRTGTYLESVASNLKFDWLGSGTSYLTGTAYIFKNLTETVDYATINGSGIILGSGKTVSGGATSGATGNTLISAQQAKTELGAKHTAVTLPTSGNYTENFTKEIQQTFRYNLTGRSTDITISVASPVAGGIYIFSFFNKSTGFSILTSGQFMTPDGSAYGSFANSLTIAGSVRFWSDGTNLYSF